MERAIEEFVPRWSLAPVVQALQSLRGVDLIVAATFVTEVGDLRRFESPRQLMGYRQLNHGISPTQRLFSKNLLSMALNKRWHLG